MINFVIIITHADGMAMIGAETSAGMGMTGMFRTSTQFNSILLLTQKKVIQTYESFLCGYKTYITRVDSVKKAVHIVE